MSLSRGVVGLALLLAFGTGCADEDAKKARKIELSFAEPVVADGGGGASASASGVPDAYVALARTARDAARDAASKCTIVNRSLNDGFSRYGESCYELRKSQVVALHAARKALDASPFAPDAGLAAGFVRRLRVIDDVTKPFDDYGRLYGDSSLLLRYQELARAWNEWRPSEATPIDLAKAPFDAGTPGRVVWQTCGEGPCLIEEGTHRP